MLYVMVRSEDPWANVMLNFIPLEKYLDIFILFSIISKTIKFDSVVFCLIKKK